ncbi:MAG TPA: VanW family protein [Candidatus Nanopelagicales bacterium]|nr:VanW family protein [Candidatus Nanopelagicales bacterium]
MGIRSVVLVVTLGALAGTGVGAGLYHVVPRSPLVRGLSIGERFPPEGASPEAWLGARRDAIEARKVWLHREGLWIEATLGELGMSIDVEATLSEARRVGHEGALTRRLREASRARRGRIDVPLVWTIDAQKARAFLEKQVAPSVYRVPVDARLDLAQRAKIPDQAGQELDVERTLSAIGAGTHEDEEEIEIAVRYRSAKVTLADLTRVDVGRVVASFETTFSLWGSGAGRAVNIANAARKIDGLVLSPGEVFSFNERVGERTQENGFTMAPEIQGDETVNGWGGGACQLASTLYAAALFGALDVLDRQSHSRPSAYIRLGLDATVSYPTVDLRFRNSLPFPVMIHAFLPKPTVIRVELLGGDPIATVEYTYGVGHVEDFTRRIYVKPHFPPGKRVRHQKGSRGLDVTSFVRVRYKDGRVDERHYFSGYRPAPEVYWVAPGYDLAELPALPEHAKGVEDLSTSSAAARDAYAM